MMLVFQACDVIRESFPVHPCTARNEDRFACCMCVETYLYSRSRLAQPGPCSCTPQLVVVMAVAYDQT